MVEVTFEEVLLKKEDVAGSNAIFFNGVVFEDVLLRLRVSHNACSCCSGLLGEETCCRTVEHEEEEVLASLVRRALRKAAGL